MRPKSDLGVSKAGEDNADKAGGDGAECGAAGEENAERGTGEENAEDCQVGQFISVYLVSRLIDVNSGYLSSKANEHF